MSNLEIMRVEPHGPADTGMVEWDPIPPGSLESGEPVQRGHVYYNDENLGLMAGVWDCTAFTGKMEPYDVNEFMLLLEGSLTMILEDGSEVVINAGDAFVIPKGLVCQWKQPGYLRKFFVIFDDASGVLADNLDTVGIILPKADGALTPVEGLEPEQFVGGGIPKQGMHEYYLDPTGQFLVGLWDSEPFERPAQPFNRHEMMCILEGSVTMSDGAGNEQVFKAGDTAYVPKGAPYVWKSTEYVKKFFCMFMPKEAAAASNAAE